MEISITRKRLIIDILMRLRIYLYTKKLFYTIYGDQNGFK